MLSEALVIHRRTRRQLLANGLLGALAMSAGHRNVWSDSPDTRVIDPTLRSVSDSLVGFLRAAQSRDGHWPSRTYALLRSGQALTPFVLSALLDADPNQRESPATLRALQWMESQTRGGTLGLADPDVLEYPVFATAFALRCLLKVNAEGLEQRIVAARKFLLAQQFTEARGFDATDLAYGGWGFGGAQPDGQTGHMDLAHTRWALSALSTADREGQRRAEYQLKAQRLLRLLQKHPDEDRVQPLGDGRLQKRADFDGGFYFSPIVLAANKGRLEEQADRPAFRSYATATCDGVLALLACGVDRVDERVVAAKRWLESHPDWDYPAGIPKKHPEPWGDAVYFYHQAARAEAYWKLGIGGDWAEKLGTRLKLHLQADGGVVNRRSPLMKENDPIMCSALALIAVRFAAWHLDANTY